jgi:hypothetical protein
VVGEGLSVGIAELVEQLREPSMSENRKVNVPLGSCHICGSK